MTSVRSISVWQDRLSRSLMWLAAIGALVASGSGIANLSSAHSSTVWLETWQSFGLLMFAGMFALLALRPRCSPGLWELAFFHKVVLAVSSFFLRNIAGVSEAGIVDTVLALLLLIAYFCGKGWLSWSR